MRNGAAGISFADASPKKCLPRPPGADIGGVGAFCASELPVCQNPQKTPTPTPSRAVQFGDASYD